MHLFLDGISSRSKGGGTPGLDRVSLYAPSGEIVSVVGPPGAGKSALLRFVGKRSDGRDGVFMGSHDNREPGQAKPGLVRGWRFSSPDDGFPPEWRTEAWRRVRIRRYAFPNMALDGSDREAPGGWSEDAGNVHFSIRAPDGAVREVGWKGPPPNDENLPDLLLVDDLCGNPAFADAEARRSFVRELHGLRSRPEWRTVIYATRDGDDALAVSDRIAVLDRGRIVQSGTPAEVHDRPANELVARLFGRPAINLVPAILEKDGQAVLIGNQTISLAGRIAEEFCRDVTVGIRPGHVRLRREGAGLRGRVASSEPHGGRALVTVNVEGVRVRALAADSHPAGERVVVSILPRHYIVFDDRGVRLDQR